MPIGGGFLVEPGRGDVVGPFLATDRQQFRQLVLGDGDPVLGGGSVEIDNLPEIVFVLDRGGQVAGELKALVGGGGGIPGGSAGEWKQQERGQNGGGDPDQLLCPPSSLVLNFFKDEEAYANGSFTPAKSK